MKLFKKVLLIVLLVVIAVVAWNYSKLNMISGYAAKNMATNVFLCERTASEVNTIDHQIPNIKIAKSTVNNHNKTVSANVFGFMMKRKAVYREGLGSVLVNSSYDENESYLIPKRNKKKSSLIYPYGDKEQQDTIFKNINYTTLNKVVNNAFDKNKERKKETRSLLVIYKDQIIAEKYLEGFTKDTKQLGWSMTKSIIGTLYGILEKKEKINIQNKVNVLEWKADDRANITYHNLLQMNSGLEWEEDYTKICDVTEMLFLDRDMTKKQLYKKAISKPNELWNYSSGTTNLLSGLLKKQFPNKQAYLNFPYESLIDKIGMHSMLLETDMEGNFVGSSYGWATTRDWAKFGLLYLHKGNWNGEQIFNPEWEKYATTPTPGSVGTYGAQIWLNAEGVFPNVPKDMYYAGGHRGQRVFIIPSKDLVIVRMGLQEIDFDQLIKDIVETIE